MRPWSRPAARAIISWPWPSANPADEVAGMAFRLSAAELAAADTYEVSDYKRIEVRLKSGLAAFVYVGA